MAKDDNEDTPYSAKIRLYVTDDLGAGALVDLGQDQAHYLQHVMRLRAGAELALFNGRDGEWLAVIEVQGKRNCSVRIKVQSQRPGPEADIWYLFAPVKRARLDYMIQKATELGATKIWPVQTRFTIASRVNLDRIETYAIEAAEQCGRLSVPEIEPLALLPKLLEGWDPYRKLIFCDEGGGTATLAAVLEAAKDQPRGPWAVLIGPEGGFDGRERELLRAQDFVVPVSLGPRILRADTAAVAALALWQMVLGDWV